MNACKELDRCVILQTFGRSRSELITTDILAIALLDRADPVNLLVIKIPKVLILGELHKNIIISYLFYAPSWTIIPQIVNPIYKGQLNWFQLGAVARWLLGHLKEPLRCFVSDCGQGGHGLILLDANIPMTNLLNSFPHVSIRIWTLSVRASCAVVACPLHHCPLQIGH